MVSCMSALFSFAQFRQVFDKNILFALNSFNPLTTNIPII